MRRTKNPAATVAVAGGLLACGLVASGLVACGDDGSAPTTGSGGGTTSSAAASSVLAAVGVTSQAGSGTAGGGDGEGGAGGAGGAGGRFVFDPIALSTPLDSVTAMHFVPGAPDDFIVLEKGGAVHHFRIAGDQAERLGGFTLEVHDALDCGLISLAFSPDFEVDRHVVMGFCESKLASRVDRFVLDLDDLASAPDTAETVLVLEEPDAAQPWHNVGSIGFEPDGTLWVLSGEKTVSANARDLSNDLGKLLRVVPEPDGPGATHAPDNPFVGQEGASPNIWAYGLRSPWKGARDRHGRYWFGDVGYDTWEEVNAVLAPATDFGWPDHEGLCDPELDDGCTDPIALYGRSSSDPYLVDDPDHLSAGTRSVWVGPFLDPVVDPEGDPYAGALDDHLLFGDLHTGFVRMLHIGEDGAVLADFPVGHLNHGHAWDRGPGGYLHVMTFGHLLASDTTSAELFRMRLE